MKTIAEFQQHYEKDLKPVLLELEGWRARISRKFVRIASAIIIAGGLLIFALYLINAPDWLLFITAGLSFVAIMIFYARLTVKFVAEFKRRIVGDIVKYLDPSLAYSPTGHVTQQQFVASRIFKHQIDRYGGEDCVSGKLDATAIKFSEIHAEYKTEHTDSKGRRRTEWHTIFKGLFFIGDFNKNFNGVTVVLPDTAE
ncbi:DUF3137 domain-containing protein, partial [bacterium]|nr:DUF3137 domain-containing protein [bacterium]